VARQVRNAKLDSRTARARLAARSSVYWAPVTRGFALGYRKGIKGGVWLAKMVRDGQRAQKTIGAADDVLDANGSTVLDYGQAHEAARRWLQELERVQDGETPSTEYTVADAIADYVLDYKRRGGRARDDLRRRCNGLIVPALGKIRVAKLSKRQVRAWHAGMAERGAQIRSGKWAPPKRRAFDPNDEEMVRRRRATANRTLSMLKAALNFAFVEGKVTSDIAWRTVKPFRQVDIARIRYLTEAECRRLVNGAEPGFRPMVQAALLTGCRYGELAQLRVGDFDPRAGTLTIARSKGGKPRHVVLDEDGTTFFTQETAERADEARMFVRPGGTPWGFSHQIRPMVEASERAKIVPAVSFHILRHTYASLLVMRGVPLQIVAANLGHVDTRMTEKHYAHLAPSHIADVIRAAMPKLGIVKRPNVVPVA
jgi:integrase